MHNDEYGSGETTQNSNEYKEGNFLDNKHFIRKASLVVSSDCPRDVRGNNEGLNVC